MKKFERKRNCPECGDEISYTQKSHKNIAEKRNTNCKSCALTKEVRKKMSEDKKGKNNPMYGKFGENNPNFGSKRSEKIKKKMRKNHADFSGKNNPMFGKKGVSWNKGKINVYSAESLLKMRLSRLKNIEKNKFNGNQMTSGYNPVGCEIINWYNMYYGFNFQHAENGGEICVDGYWPDGLDENQKTIIEIDEPRHFNSDGTYKEKDIRRQRYLEGVGYKFIRIRI